MLFQQQIAEALLEAIDSLQHWVLREIGDQAKLAVESRTFPLLIYDPRKGDRVRERLSLQGNPTAKEDWVKHPKTGEPVDFIAFARTEGRFARHFADGQPDEFIQQAQRDRLENWHKLQELAGLR